MRAFSVALAAVLVLCLPWMLSGCGSSSDATALGNAANRQSSDGVYDPLTVDLIAGGGVDGNQGWDAGDVTLEYSADGNTLSVGVVLDTGVTFDTDPVKLYASSVKPDSGAVIPGTGLPLTLTKDDASHATGSFNLGTAGANLYLLLHAVVCKEGEDGGGGSAYSAALIGVDYTWDIKVKGQWETHLGTTDTTGEIISGSDSNLAGHYTVSTDDTYFMICVDLEPGYSLGKIHFLYQEYAGGTFDVNNEWADYVVTNSGKLIPGQFPYTFMADTAYDPYVPDDSSFWDAYTEVGGAHDYCIKFLLSDVFAGYPASFDGCIPFVAALHLDMDYHSGDTVTHVTGWGEQPFDWNSGMIFGFEVCQHPGGGGGEEICDTAWAEDPTAEDTEFHKGPHTYMVERGFFPVFPWSDGGLVHKWGWVFYYPGSPGDPWS